MKVISRRRMTGAAIARAMKVFPAGIGIAGRTFTHTNEFLIAALLA